MIEKRALAPGMDVSLIGLGTVKLGRNQQVKYPSAFELPSDAAVVELLQTAQALGINLLDTAPAYGLAEARIGQLRPGHREDWVIGTKVGEHFDGQSYFDFSYDGAKTSLNTSLERLNTDYLDYALLHSDGNDLAVLGSGARRALQEAQSAGWIRAIGISSKTQDGAMRALDMGLDIVMLTLNPEHSDEGPAAARAHELSRGVLVKKAMGSGHLPAKQALPWVAAQPGITSIISGTLNPEHLRQNVLALSQES